MHVLKLCIQLTKKDMESALCLFREMCAFCTNRNGEACRRDKGNLRCVFNAIK